MHTYIHMYIECTHALLLLTSCSSSSSHDQYCPILYSHSPGFPGYVGLSRDIPCEGVDYTAWSHVMRDAHWTSLLSSLPLFSLSWPPMFSFFSSLYTCNAHVYLTFSLSPPPSNLSAFQALLSNKRWRKTYGT